MMMTLLINNHATLGNAHERVCRGRAPELIVWLINCDGTIRLFRISDLGSQLSQSYRASAGPSSLCEAASVEEQEERGPVPLFHCAAPFGL
jgi:hypothetical protein